MKPFILISLLSLLQTVAVCQNVGKMDVRGATQKLIELQNDLEKADQQTIDASIQAEIDRLEISSESKGEFETTKQFEARQEKERNRIMRLQEDAASRSREQKANVLREMNKILRLEFVVRANSGLLGLGNYDADQQIFPIYFGDQIEVLRVPLNEAKVFKTSFSQAERILTTALIIDENNRVRDYMVHAEIEVNGKVYPTTNDLSVSRAMRMVYGNYDAGTNASRWTATSKDVIESRDSPKRKSKAFGIKEISINGTKKKILLAGEDDGSGPGCAACGQIFTYAIFENEKGYWKIESVVKDAGQYGGSGMLGEPKLVVFGRDKYAFVFWSGRASGFFDHYFEIGEAELKYLFSVETGADDGSTYKSDVRFLSNPTSTYFDARVTISGSKYVEVGKKQVLSRVDRTDIYKFVDGKYRLVGR